MTADADARQLVHEAWQSFAGGDLAGATARARTALQAEPAFAPAAAALGFFLLRADALDEAEAVLGPAGDRWPDHAPLHWYTGYLCQRRGNLVGAAVAFERACRLDPSLHEAAHALAWTLHDLGRLDEALGWARHALSYARTAPRLLQTGWLLQATGRIGPAVPIYREAVAAYDLAASEQPRLALHLTQCLRALKQDAEADAVLRRARERWPDDAVLQVETGWRQRGQGDPHGALHRMRALLRSHPDEASAWHLLGVLQQEFGELEAADAAFAEVLQRNPRWNDALMRRAQIRHAGRRYAEALALLAQVPASSPDAAAAAQLRAQVLLDQDEVDAARRGLVTQLRSAGRRGTASGAHAGVARAAESLRLLAAVHARRGRARRALRLLQQVLALAPDNLDALRMLGWLARAQGDAALAVRAVGALVQRAPGDMAVQAQAALVLAESGALPQAEACAERAVAQAPDQPAAWRALARVRRLQRRLDEAEAAVQQALRLAPDDAESLREFGQIAAEQAEPGQALQAFAQALARDPGNAEARLALARAQGRIGDAAAGLATLAPLRQARPDWLPALAAEVSLLADGGLAGALAAAERLVRRDRHTMEAVQAVLRLVGLGEPGARRLLPLLPVAALRAGWRAAIEQAVHTQGHDSVARLVQAACEELDEDPWSGAAALYLASLSSGTSADALARQARDWHRGLKLRSGLSRLPAPVRAATGSLSDARPRIAYVASQLHEPLLRRVLAAHAPERAQVYVYAPTPLAGLPAHIRQQPLVPAALAESCAANGIEVLIDAGGLHPFEGQFDVLQAYARRAAPVQVGWLGLGCGAGGLFDALLADAAGVPAVHEAELEETVLRLAGGAWCWDPPAGAPPVGPLPALARGHVTFGVTARGLKLDAACLDAFARIVAATPGSVIRFIGQAASDGPQRRTVFARFAAQGVDAARVAFDPFRPPEAYRQWLAGIDLVLDSFPGNGALSLLDPLWMGVPVVTLAGGWLGARQGASLLAAIGTTDWVAEEVDAFCATAVALAADPAALAAHRAALRARIEASPLLDGRRVAAQVEALCAGLARRHADVIAAPDPKARVKARARLALDAWLARPGPIVLPAPAPGDDVVLSVVVVLYNQAGLSRATLQALADQRGLRFETVVIDNASSDRTRELLARVQGARMVRNDANLGFLRAARQGAALARGRYLAFLNSDAILQPGALAATLRTLQADASIGALGGRVVLGEGGLQEAGNRVFRDGLAGGIGRGEDAFAPAALAGRSTDYVSGVFLATPVALWRMLGGFDERLAPAYYEDTDYCLRVWRAGFRVWYEPTVLLEHLESASATAASGSAATQMERSRAVFRELHAPWLAGQPLPQALPLDGDRWAAPDDLPRRPRVLFIDNEVPHMAKGGGLPRARLMLQALRDWPVTLYPLWEPQDSWRAVYATLPRTVEVALAPGGEGGGWPGGLQGLEAFLERRRGVYDVLLVSRPPNLQALAPLRARRPELFAGLRLVYDAEALFALREIAAAGVAGRPLSREAARTRLANELALARGASDVLVVSRRDARHFEAAGHRTHLLGHSVAARRLAPGPVGRQGLLFVGALHRDTPNEDGLLWFLREVMPHLRQRAQARGQAVPVLSVVGVCLSERVMACAADDVRILGPQPALEPFYDAARVFIAPVRFAGGVPAKVIEAAAAGVPTVASALLVRQLGWRDGLDVLGARDAAAFAQAIARLLDDDSAWQRQQQGAWDQCARHYDPQGFADTLRRVLVGPDEERR